MTDEEIIREYKKYTVLYNRMMRKRNPEAGRESTRKYRAAHLEWDRNRKHEAYVKKKIEKVKAILGTI